MIVEVGSQKSEVRSQNLKTRRVDMIVEMQNVKNGIKPRRGDMILLPINISAHSTFATIKKTSQFSPSIIEFLNTL